MAHWNSSPHPISDIRDWVNIGRLELRPDYQRKAVWGDSAKIMLIDTILRDVPMPKVFLANSIKDGNTYRVVIDGQQRITAILEFLRDNFSLTDPYAGEEFGKKFSELDEETQNRILSYQIDFNEAVNVSDEEAREVYARVNKYTIPLTKQELRRADFPGDFLNVSEELAVEDFFDKASVFTPANRRRYGDVEYVSELLAGMIDGIQDKKETLDNFYMKFSKWEKDNKDEIISRFNNVLSELEKIFNDSLNLSKTRFRQKADFYTIFLVIDEFARNGATVEGKSIDWLQEDLKILDYLIRPESESDICSEYAIKCVSQANSASSRRWRHAFMKSVLAGTYDIGWKDSFRSRVYYSLTEEDSDPMCPPREVECSVCNSDCTNDLDNCLLAWGKSESVNQISNSSWIHRTCTENQTEWVFMERPNNEQQPLF